MLPDFLKPFENHLSTFEKSIIRIKAQPLEDALMHDPLDLQQSKFMGFPFLPVSRSYPIDEDGANMYLLAQINFAEMPPLEDFPKAGLLQLYFSPQGWWEMDATVLYIRPEELQEEHRTSFSFLNEQDYEDTPIQKIHQLNFSKETDYGGTEDHQFAPRFGDLELWAFLDTLSDKQQDAFQTYFNAFGHKLGGYAQFAQGDVRDKADAAGFDVQVLQIDVDDYISFGDAGTIHVFIHPDDLQKQALEKAYFYWDCY